MKRILTPAEEIAEIRRALKHFPLERQVSDWLNTGSTRLNGVLGSPELGVPYGKIIELYGPNSHGKTMLALLLAALAQRQGAEVAWVDLEQSFDKPWVEAQGLHYDEVYLFDVRVLQEGKASCCQCRTPLQKRCKNCKHTLCIYCVPDKVRLQNAQELCEEVEMWMDRRFKRNPSGKRVVVVDSVAALLTEEEENAGITGQNLRTQMALPSFLSRLFRRWVALAANYNTMIIVINQIRTKAMAFGDPEYSPGGNAKSHYCSVRVKVRRLKGGRLMQGRKIVGLKGLVTNVKNKAGGGSLEGGQCGFWTLFGKRKWKFPSKEELKADGGIEEE